MANSGIDAVLANWSIEPVLREANRQLQSRNVVGVERLCRDAVTSEPGASDAWHLLAVALAEQNQLAEAARAIQRAVELLPGNAAYWVTRGIIESDRNLLEEAQASFRHAIQVDPKLYQAHYLLATSYHRADKLPDAIAAYRQALRGLPNRPEIRFHLARALLAADRPAEALAAFEEAFSADRECRLDRRECFNCFQRLPIKALPSFWQSELVRFFSRQDVDKSRYSSAALYALMSKPPFRALLGAGNRNKGGSDLSGVSQVMEDTLFGILLRDAVIAHPQFEIALTRLRAALLFDDPLRMRSPLQFLCDFALQCFNNEFVYSESEAETGKLAGLAYELENALCGGGPRDEGFMRGLAVFAMYRPLHGLAGIDTLLAEPPTGGPAALLLRRTVGDVLEERRLRSGIAAIGQTVDPTSCAVRAQYEKNPYPRWIAFDRTPPVPVSRWLASEIPGGYSQSNRPAPFKILVAGCGTGIEAVSLAANFTDVRVTALDLSVSSLAYGKRKSNELGLANIEFYQGDILELEEIPERFDAILCVGVLHHLREPQAGLRTLVRLARPGGFLKIGLYSERARASVNAVRALIRERQLAPTEAAIRAIRQEALAAGQSSSLSGLLRWRDFFTMSECRDLLFHVQELQFAPAHIAEMLRAEKLSVLGFSNRLSRQALSTYRRLASDKAGTTDLQVWDAVEAQLPDTFEGMYVFWCQTAQAG